MHTLSNGLKIFNATPHPITFWDETWKEPVTVPPDEVINAKVEEEEVGVLDIPPDLPSTWSEFDRLRGTVRVTFVRPRFVGTPDGEEIAKGAYRNGADLVVGSIIAAQAYPGLVVAMTPAPGYERKPPNEKRMSPCKFTIYAPFRSV